MGVNIIVKLPSTCSVKNVAKVIGILAGLKAKKQYFSNEGYGVEVEGLEINGIVKLPAIAEIVLNGDLVDGEKIHTVFYHFEASDWNGSLISPRSTPFWIAISKHLVDFFGGQLIYQDCGDQDIDYENPNFGSIDDNRPSDGDAWYVLQERFLNLKPITEAEITYFSSVAAYK